MRFDVGAVVFVESFSRATVEALNPESFLDTKMVFEALLVFVVDARKDFGRPIHIGFAVLFVLCEARVGPAFVVDCFLVLGGAEVDSLHLFAL